MRKRVTYRPSKAGGVFALIAGLIFVGIGCFVVIPVFGPFGVFWTLIAVVITGAGAYQAFSGKYIGPEIHIEDDEPASGDRRFREEPRSQAPVDLNAKARLEQLESLRASGLLTEAEYQQKREDVLRSL